MSRLVDKYMCIYIYNILYKTNIFYHILVQRNAFPSTGGLAMGTLSRSESKSDRGHFRGTTPRFWVANSIGMCKKHHQISAVGPAAESSSVQLWTSLLDFWAFSFLGTKRWEKIPEHWTKPLQATSIIVQYPRSCPPLLAPTCLLGLWFAAALQTQSRDVVWARNRWDICRCSCPPSPKPYLSWLAMTDL